MDYTFPSPELDALRLVLSCLGNVEEARAVATLKSDTAICASNAAYWMQIAEALRPGAKRA